MTNAISDDEDILFEVDSDGNDHADEPVARPEKEDLDVLDSQVDASRSSEIHEHLREFFGPGDQSFDALAAANESLPGESSPGLVPCRRRLLWSRWLGVFQADAPAQWLVEARQNRREFEACLRKAEQRDDRGAWELRRNIELDIVRCFPDRPELQTPEVGKTLTSILLAHAEQRAATTSSKRETSVERYYFQGFPDLIAVILQVCWDGAIVHESDETEKDSDVYVELVSSSRRAVMGDAFAIFNALMHRCRLIEMFDPGQSEEVIGRCHRIVSALGLVDPDLQREIYTWQIEPQVLLLRWVRLLFIRELEFPTGVLTVWDSLFADAALRNTLSCTASEQRRDALPLIDFMALAMLLDLEPTGPEQVFRYGEAAHDVYSIAALAYALMTATEAAPLAPGPAAISELRAWRSRKNRRQRGDEERAVVVDATPSHTGPLSDPFFDGDTRPDMFPQPPRPRVAAGTAGLVPNSPTALGTASFHGVRSDTSLSMASVSAFSSHTETASPGSSQLLSGNSAGDFFGSALGWAASQLERAAATARDAMTDDPNAPWGSYDDELPIPRRPPGYILRQSQRSAHMEGMPRVQEDPELMQATTAPHAERTTSAEETSQKLRDDSESNLGRPRQPNRSDDAAKPATDGNAPSLLDAAQVQQKPRGARGPQTSEEHDAWTESSAALAERLKKIHKDEQQRTKHRNSVAKDIWDGAAKGDIEVVSSYLQKGLDISRCDPDTSHTPLGWAVGFGRRDMVSWLLQAKASANAEMRDRATALHVAAFFGRADQATQLIKAGANVNARSTSALGETPFDMTKADMAVTAAVARSFKLRLDRKELETGRERIRQMLENIQTRTSQSSQTYSRKPATIPQNNGSQHPPQPSMLLQQNASARLIDSAVPGACSTHHQNRSGSAETAPLVQQREQGAMFSAHPSQQQNSSVPKSTVEPGIPRPVPSSLLDSSQAAKEHSYVGHQNAADMQNAVAYNRSSMVAKTAELKGNGSTVANAQFQPVAHDRRVDLANAYMESAVDLKGYSRSQMSNHDLSYEGAIDAKAFSSWSHQQPHQASFPMANSGWSGADGYWAQRAQMPPPDLIYDGAVDEKGLKRAGQHMEAAMTPMSGQHP